MRDYPTGTGTMIQRPGDGADMREEAVRDGGE